MARQPNDEEKKVAIDKKSGSLAYNRLDIINVWLQVVEVGVLDDNREKSVIPTSLEDEIAIIRRECSVNCTNDIVKLLDERIALQLEELDFEIREEGNKTNLYKMHDEYKIDLEMLSKDVN